MKILGLRIDWSHSGRRRRRKVPTKLERIATAAMLDTVLRDAETLTMVIDKYGQIQVLHDDETGVKIQNIRAKIYREAVQTLLNSRSQELASRIDGIIDRVMDAANRSKGRYEEDSFAGVNIGGQNGASAANRQCRTSERGSMHTSSLSALLKDLEVLAILGKLDSQRIQMNGGVGAGKIYAVEYNGQIVEMDENEYKSYVRRRRGRQRKETQGHPPDMVQQPRLFVTNKPMPVPPEENED